MQPELKAFITNSESYVRCKFPWCNDIVVDRCFWDCFVGMDETREGWLRDEVIKVKLNSYSNNNITSDFGLFY